jgi:multidrug transporter EmrE-like cation transporter
LLSCFEIRRLASLSLKVPQLSTPVTTAISHPGKNARRNSFLLVFACTILGAAAQLLIKTGMNHFSPHWVAVVTNLPLVAGYTIYGVNTLMMVLALKNAEMSMLYPIIALTYVWTTLLSYTLLGEPSNLYKNIGIVTIVLGVAVMGRRGKP